MYGDTITMKIALCKYWVLSGTHAQASVLMCISHGNPFLQDKLYINITAHADQPRHLGHKTRVQHTLV